VAFRPKRGLLYYDSFLYVIHIESCLASEPRSGPEERARGPLLRIALDVEKRPRAAPPR
jgi:hypothetical protein